MWNAYFPEGTEIVRIAGSDSVTVYADGEAVEYKTFVPGQTNHHDPDTCDNCIAVAEERERLKLERDAEPFEHLFDDVGLGRDESDDEEDAPEHDKNKILACNGIQDIIFTGKVNIHSLIGVAVMDADFGDSGRRTSVMVWLGTISITMAASGSGMD
jgi:hypothetical protein